MEASRTITTIAHTTYFMAGRSAAHALQLSRDENPSMLSSPSSQNKPLTPLMLAALQHLASHADQAFVRLHSNYWIAESEEKKDPLFREMRDLDDRFLASGSLLYANLAPLVAIRTPTVKAMVARGLLKFMGPKRIVRGAGNSKDYARAVLTAQATAIRAELEDRSQAAYEEVLRRFA